MEVGICNFFYIWELGGIIGGETLEIDVHKIIQHNMIGGRIKTQIFDFEPSGISNESGLQIGNGN